MAEVKSGRVVDKRFVELTAMGMTPEQAQAYLAAQEPDAPDTPRLDAPMAVWPENWPALGLFLRLQTQWVRNAAGGLEALSYPAAEAAMNMLGTADRAQVFDHLVEMEHAALEAWYD